jgi:tetratricopeptide (TPR) repeat protein
MTDIGALYYSGLGVPQDFATAREWFEKAAAAGHSLAMSNLGRIYADGQGVPRDYAKAREWYEKAAAAGDWNALGQLSWHALFAREYGHALDATERALKAAPELLWIATNRAHALMFLGRAAEAREIYLTYKDKLIAQNDNKTWQQVIAEDFDELRRAGLNHPQMAEIEAALGIAGR